MNFCGRECELISEINAFEIKKEPKITSSNNFKYMFCELAKYSSKLMNLNSDRTS